jgi:hypothetical protein
MLRTTCLISRPRCSKAPRGLFVLSWVTRIFTGLSISPSPLSRQCSTRYSFRAGRNLPDKEFRYLRTVIVTAAVHRGLDSRLRTPLLVTFRHWAGVSPYTSACALAETCVFGKQSVEPISCSLLTPSLCREEVTQAPLLPKVRGQFAEFLDRGSLVHLKRLLFAYRCRCAVRADRHSGERLFSAAWGSMTSAPLRGLGSGVTRSCIRDFPRMRASTSPPLLSIRAAHLPYRVPPLLITSGSGAGISCLLAIAYDLTSSA